MKKPKRNYSRTIDLAFLLVLLIAIIYAFTAIYRMDLLPMLWLAIALLITLLLYLLLFRSALRKRAKWFVYGRRALICMLCGVLFIGGFFSDKLNTLMNDISQTTTIQTEIRVLARNDGSVTSLRQLQNTGTIGIQNGTDQDNGAYAKQQLQKALGSAAFQEDTYYGDLLGELAVGNLDAVAISDTYYDMMIDNGSIDAERFTTLETYTYTRTWEDPSNKDLTRDGFTVYISGIDEMGSPDQKLRSDVNILLFINPRARHVTMISLPRDAYLPNKAYASSENSMDKLTHTGLYGVDTTIETVEDFLDIDIDYYARVSFSSVIEIVDALGGIDVDVELDFCEQDENRNKDAAHQICLAKGKQHLDGREALAYSRHRKTEGYDTAGRERAQQRIIKAIIAKLLSLDGISALNELFAIIPSYVITNMPPAKMSEFAKEQLSSLKAWSIESLSLDNGANTHLMYQASLNDLSDAYVFSRQDVQYIEYAYESNGTNPLMKDFTFDLNDLAKNKKQIKDQPEYVWSDEVVAY